MHSEIIGEAERDAILAKRHIFGFEEVSDAEFGFERNHVVVNRAADTNFPRAVEAALTAEEVEAIKVGIDVRIDVDFACEGLAEHRTCEDAEASALIDRKDRPDDNGDSEAQFIQTGIFLYSFTRFIHDNQIFI